MVVSVDEGGGERDDAVAEAHDRAEAKTRTYNGNAVMDTVGREETAERVGSLVKGDGRSN
jgi:hypothetical protein